MMKIPFSCIKGSAFLMLAVNFIRILKVEVFLAQIFVEHRN